MCLFLALPVPPPSGTHRWACKPLDQLLHSYFADSLAGRHKSMNQTLKHIFGRQTGNRLCLYCSDCEGLWGRTKH